MTKRKRLTKTKTGLIISSPKSEVQKDVPFLPEEIIVNILGRLPAKFLHHHARYVCKTWAHMLHRLLPLDCVLLVHETLGQPCARRHYAWFLEMNKGKLEVTYEKLRLPGPIQGSSGGVLLIYNSSYFQALYVANPVTMQVVKLPPVPARISSVGNNIACIPHTGELKVACAGKDINERCHWYILTVGSNMSWRKIDSAVQGFYPNLCLCEKSISAGGVLYWNKIPRKLDCNILALDLRDETVHNIRVPNELCDVYGCLLKMGNYLSYISWGPTGTMKAFLLKDLHQNEWAITYRFDLNEKNPILRYYSTPIAWLEDHQIMIFRVHKKTCTRYVEFNGKTGKWKNIKSVDTSHHDIEVHTNSLVVL